MIERTDVTLEQINELCNSLGAANRAFFRAQQKREFNQAYEAYSKSCIEKRYTVKKQTKEKMRACLNEALKRLKSLKAHSESMTFWELLGGYKEVTGAKNNALSSQMGYNRTFISITYNRSLTSRQHTDHLKEDLELFIERAIETMEHTLLTL